MRISINNFKSIGSLANYEMKPLTILSGTNSSGKSSFIQLLLLLKQTLEDDSAERKLDLGGKWFPVRNYLDILKGKTNINKLKVEFVFNKSEVGQYDEFYEINFYNAAFDDYDLHIEIEFDEYEREIIVSSFSVKIISNNKAHHIKFENNGTSFNIETNVAVFSEKLFKEDYTIRKINYSSFIPSNYEIEFKNGNVSLEVPRFGGVKAVLKSFFKNLNYIGPLRQSPKDDYASNGKNNSVGIEGENLAEALYELSNKSISYFRVEEIGDEVTFIKSDNLFINAVKYWVCERFKLCTDIYLRKDAETYVIYIISLSGIESTIKHVGFGISQVLPIIVEGLRIGSGEILALEQPEIHLHPKVQSSLTDFLISLVNNNKKVIIETHSDHLITRLRRRIAEDSNNELDDKVLLTFVEVGSNDILFKNISIDDFGVLELPYPKDFIEKPDTELKAILKAQMKKRLNKKT
jgi:hypothetical protein